MKEFAYFLDSFQLFSTEWIECEGCIVNTDWDNVEKFVNKKLKENMSRRDIELSINHIHVSPLLEMYGCSCTKQHRSTFTTLCIAIIYYRLKIKYPNKEFNFEKVEDAKETTIRYCQK